MTDFDKKKFSQYILKDIVTPLVKNIVDNKLDIYRNTLDPFSALVDCMVRDVSPLNWKAQEEGRQSQKTLQNKIGTMHEYVIDCFEGWDNLKTGKVIDIVNKEKRIIAEIKNKHNTTKGNHKKDIYDDLASELKKNYKGYTAYYVEILPKDKAIYNTNFTPTDNTKGGKHRASRNDIKIIDGASFYELVSGDKNFLKKLYSKILPEALQKAINELNKTRKQKLPCSTNITKDALFREFFDEAFQ